MGYSDEVLVQIRERTDYEALFGEFLDLKGRGAERMALCIFHENTHTPALSVNIEDGLYRCHNPACDARGDFVSFFMRVRSLTFTEAVVELARRVGIEMPDPSRTHHHAPPPSKADEDAVLANYVPPKDGDPKTNGKKVSGPESGIDERVVEAMHARLMESEPLLEYLHNRRGIDRTTVVRFRLGHDGQRYYIPVRDQAGVCVNIRRYKPDAKKAADKMISWRVGYGEARLFPLHMVAPDSPLYVMEGEMDCLLARQLGLNAVTATGGAGTWRDIWNPLFAGQEVVICYDVDDAGRAGAHHVAASLIEVAKSVRVVKLPLTEPVGADFTDYIVGHGHGINDFLSLALQTPLFEKSMASLDAGRVMQEPVQLHLSAASEGQYYNTPVKINVMVSGKHTSPYMVPSEVTAGQCGRPGLPMCERCPVDRAGTITKKMEFANNDILQFIEVTTAQQAAAVKRKLGVPTKCGMVKIETVKAMNIEMIQVIPEVERTESETPYVTRQAFFMGHGLKANQSYTMTGITVPEPKRQMVTHLIHSAVASQSNIDAFHLDKPTIERLRSFQPTERGTASGLWHHLSTIYADIERFTRIYERQDLMIAVDLVFHSPLTFVFQGDSLVRGWCEALVIGDSRTGKTTIVERMIHHYRAGEFASGENTSFAGLLGGLHQIGTTWALQWGRFPLNDRRLLAIDEAGDMSTDDIARLSSMRSSGVAQITKIHTEKTSARTRGIWITNPRFGRTLSEYSQGVLAVKDLIGSAADIARFDLVVAAATGEVALAVVNAPREQEAPEVFTSEVCHQRVMWAWSRKSEHIRFADGAVDEVLKVSMEHGYRYRYATSIPLVEPNEQRIKIARLAVSTAAMFFSTDETGQQVIVRPEHVQFVAQYLDMLYSKPSMSFNEYADQQRKLYELSDIGHVQRIVNHNPRAAQAFMQMEYFTINDLEEILRYNDRAELRACVAQLKECGFLKRVGKAGYVKTPAAIRWLRQQLVMAQDSPPESISTLMHVGAELPDEPSW